MESLKGTKPQKTKEPENSSIPSHKALNNKSIQIIDNLKRGGSDYTATIIGAVVEADEVQIWTDIDGMHNNDPRCVENTHAISNLSFDEAAELAYFGAKILHPQTSDQPPQIPIP